LNVEGAKECLGRNVAVEGQQKEAVVIEELNNDKDEVLINPMFVD